MLQYVHEKGNEMKMNRGNILAAVTVAVVLVLFGLFVRFDASANTYAVLKASGMTCSSCSGKVEQALRNKPGVSSVRVDLPSGLVLVGYDGRVLEARMLAEDVSKAGFSATVQRVLDAKQYAALMGGSSSGGGCGNCNSSSGCGGKAAQQ
ncbi:MAG: hypothetical protein GJT30_00665 [Geobacter sp.]|nr:hypothetical protein [Geobacter sp.]